MAERPSFQARQYAFAAHIRDPEQEPVPDGIDARRMAVYRELFFNNLKRLLGTTFPVLRKLYGESGWQRLVRAFMRQHRAMTPYFPQLPREFLSFLEDEYTLTGEDYPFLFELAHYEYVELEVSLCDATDDAVSVEADADLLEGVPIVCAACRVRTYSWPVHRISADHLPVDKAEQPVHLAVFRDPDDKVRFVELNTVTAALLTRLLQNDARQTGRSLLEDLAVNIGWEDDVAEFVAHGAVMLDDMYRLGLLAGSRKP